MDVFRATLTLTILALIAACGSTPIAIIPIAVLDQDSGITNGNPSVVNNGLDKAQTFTVGVSGLLTRIDLMLFEENAAFAPLLIDVRETTAGVPNEDNGVVLLSFMVPEGSLTTMADEFASFDVSGFGVTVTQGQLLAIVLRAPGATTSGWNWQSTGGDPYAGGSNFFRPVPGTWPAPGTGDHGFKTYVLP